MKPLYSATFIKRPIVFGVPQPHRRHVQVATLVPRAWLEFDNSQPPSIVFEPQARLPLAFHADGAEVLLRSLCKLGIVSGAGGGHSEAQRRANRRCAVFSRSVQRLEGARLSAMLDILLPLALLFLFCGGCCCKFSGAWRAYNCLRRTWLLNFRDFKGNAVTKF